MRQLTETTSFGITGEQYYWTHRRQYDISLEELKVIGLTSGKALVHVRLKEPLLAVDALFRKGGYRLHVKDGYRSPELYDLVRQKRVQKFGEYDTDRSLNTKHRPHASGFVVDVALISLDDESELELRDRRDGVDAYFIDYYRKAGASHDKTSLYTERQEYLRNTMQRVGWKLGELQEIWHFEWPHEPDGL